jgi:hypothetical protein
MTNPHQAMGDPATEWVVFGDTCVGPSTVTKPAGWLANGALAIEVDTGNIYQMTSGAWVLMVKTQNIPSDTTVAALAGEGTPSGSNKFTTASFVRGLLAGIFRICGNYDAHTNVWPSTGGTGEAGAIVAGDLWQISVAGTLSGDAVNAGDIITAIVDTPGQTGTNWIVLERNLGFEAAKASDLSTHAGLTASVHGFDSAGKAVPSTHASTHVAGADEISGVLRIYADITAMKAATGVSDRLCYVDSIDTICRYVAAGSAYVADDIYAFTTGDGGNTRWVAESGAYIYNPVTLKQTMAVIGAAYSPPIQLTLTAGAVAPNLALGNNYYLTLDGADTLSNATGGTPGQSGVIEVLQPAGGTATLAYGNGYVFTGGVAPTVALGANVQTNLTYYVQNNGKIWIEPAGGVA